MLLHILICTPGATLTDACCGGAQGSVLVRPAAPLYHLSQVSAPPLAGGYTVGDKVFFTGKTQTFESGDMALHGGSEGMATPTPTLTPTPALPLPLPLPQTTLYSSPHFNSNPTR